MNIIGCTPNKSLILQFPEDTIFGKKILIYDFIRGYCDGDGCLYFNEKTSHTPVSIVGTFPFLQKVSSYLNITPFQIRNKSCKNWPNKAFELRYSGSAARRVARILYENSTIYLDRKYDKFKSFCRFEEESSRAKSSKIGEGCDANPEITSEIAKGSESL